MSEKFPNVFECGPIKNPQTGKWDVLLVIKGEGTEAWANGEAEALLKIMMGEKGEHGKLFQVGGKRPS